MADVLVDFLNHGALPFVGRKAEQGRILHFWSERGDERFALETLLLTGEGGVGKSRLIEETIPAIEAQRGAVVHVKLRPEGATSLIPLIVNGIERSESARSLFRTLPSETYGAAVGALRRICALRRTLLVVEDIHLLDGASLHEFSLLLEGLRDESLGLLAATRPVESSATDILEAYITEEITLDGLETEAIEEMWHLLFNGRAENTAYGSGTPAAMLKETTRGNALALRSALRGGIRIGSLKRPGDTERLEIRIEPWAFRESARRAAHAVVTGMIAGLEADLLVKACRLAQLGEVFSNQAAAGIVEEADQVIAALTFKGILTRTTTSSTPINSTRQHGSPVSFTHSLVHDELLAEAPESICGLVRSLGSDGPIYTYLPYRIVSEHEGVANVPAQEIAGAIRACCYAARLVNMVVDWRNADVPLNAAKRMITWLPADFSEEERQELHILLLWAELDLRVRSVLNEEHWRLAGELLEATATDPALFDYQLIALEHQFRNATDFEKGDGREIFEAAAALAAANPKAKRSHRYSQLLYVAATAAHNRDDKNMLSRIEGIMEEILEDEQLTEENRKEIVLRLLPSFLVLVNSRSAMEKRMHQLEELLPLLSPLNRDILQKELAPYLQIQCFYLVIGEIDKLLELGKQLAPVLHRHGLRQSYYLIQRWAALGECLSGTLDPHDVEHWHNLIQEVYRDGGLSDFEKERLHLSAVRSYHNAAYLLGDISLMDAILEEWNIDIGKMNIANRMLHVLWRKDYTSFAATIQDLPPDLRPLASIATTMPESEEEGTLLLEKNIAHLRDLPYDLFQFIRIYIAIEIIERSVEAGTVPITEQTQQTIHREAHNALDYCLNLLAERHLPLLMAPLLCRYGKYFSRNERRGWEERISELNAARLSANAPTLSARIGISMLDTVAVDVPGREGERLRGGRSTTLLGLLVANRMLKYPLDRPDFFALASGVENDPDRARTATNVAVLRLREIVGKETILTGNDLPELNGRLTHVDLLSVWDALERGEKELHSGHLLSAREAARQAVTVGAGRVAFPGLYDELFERLREDLETRLQGLVLAVAGRLIDADDPKEAEELLRVWNERVPGDEAGLELLAKALEHSGERAQAVAVRQRASVVG